MGHDESKLVNAAAMLAFAGGFVFMLGVAVGDSRWKKLLSAPLFLEKFPSTHTLSLVTLFPMESSNNLCRSETCYEISK